MKNIFSLAVIAAAGLSLGSCASNNIAYDYDKSFNFANVKTYDYYADNSLQLNSIDSSNFMRTLDGVLQSKGLTRSSNPDIYVAVMIKNAAGSKTSSVGIGIGGGNRWLGLGTGIGIPVSSKVMNYAFQIDMDNAANKQLVWTTRSEKTTSYNASTDNKMSFYKSTLEGMFKNYPVETKNGKTVKSNYYN